MSALVLALDTATEMTAVAIGIRDGDDVEVLASCDTEAPRAAMSNLVPRVRDLLEAADITAQDLAEVVVGRGPGSFTGVRIGVATAKGIAYGLGVPLYGVGTLDAVAWRLARELGVGETAGGAMLGVVGDAMRGEVYPLRFTLSPGSASRLDDYTVAEPGVVADAWAAAGQPTLLAGNGLRKYRELFETVLGPRAHLVPESLWAPTGAGLLAAYASATKSGEAGSGEPGALLPIYTRLSDAEEAEQVSLRSTAPTAPGRPGSGVPAPPGPTPASGVRGPASIHEVSQPEGEN